jgi:LAS superfamily LD-carboxypeptidase LdcB
MPQTRRSSRGRHRAPAASARTPFPAPRLRVGRIAKGALALGLVLSLGGYTVAESATQRESAAAARSAVTAAAQAYAQVAAERTRARATARTAVEDATSVRTVASASVTAVELDAITAAVAQVNTLVAQLPTTRTAPLDPAAPAAAGAGRAARGVVRKPVPAAAGVATATSASLASAPAPGSTPAAGAPAAAAGSPAAGPDAPTVDAAPAPDVLAPVAPSPTDGTRGRPLTHGDLAAVTREAVQSRAPADDAAPTDELAAQIMVAVARLADVTAKVQDAAQANMSAVQAASATADQASAAAAAAAKKMALRTSLDAYANGRVPADALCPIDFAPGQQLRCDAVAPLAALNASFKAQFGADLIVSDSYRSYSDQVVCSRTKGSLCATPGTSDHGRGVAVDLGSGVERFGSVQSRWMNVNAGKYGWIWPEWARPTGSNPEPWQWDFTG